MLICNFALLKLAELNLKISPPQLDFKRAVIILKIELRYRCASICTSVENVNPKMKNNTRTHMTYDVFFHVFPLNSISISSCRLQEEAEIYQTLKEVRLAAERLEKEQEQKAEEERKRLKQLEVGLWASETSFLHKVSWSKMLKSESHAVTSIRRNLVI